MKRAAYVPVFALALAAAQASLAAGPEEQPDARQEKKICRTERATGSLTRRTRICLTAAEWRELNDRTRKGVDEMTGSGAPRCISGGLLGPTDVSCGAPTGSGESSGPGTGPG